MSGVRKSLGAKASAVLAKAKVAASHSKERIGRLIPHSSSNLDEPEETKRLARLDTKFFATPDRAIAADKTCGPCGPPSGSGAFHAPFEPRQQYLLRPDHARQRREAHELLLA